MRVELILESDDIQTLWEYTGVDERAGALKIGRLRFGQPLRDYR